MTTQQQGKTVQVQYYALLREERGLSEETVVTSAGTVAQLYEDLRTKYKFKLAMDFLKVAVNDEYTDWNRSIQTGDQIVFIPPVAGG